MEINLCLFQQSMLRKIFDRHELIRQDVTQVIFPFPSVTLNCSKFLIMRYLFFRYFRSSAQFVIRNSQYVLSFHLNSHLLSLFGITTLDAYNVFFYFNSGCSRLYQLWCQYGRILLWSLQILWWWCNILCLLLIRD